jgi:hypothetical protein
MIFFKFNIRNPLWSDRWANIKAWHGKTPWKHKFWEAQASKDSVLIGFEFNWRFRTDHAGFQLGADLLGYSIEFSFYDSRHWNEEENRFYNYNESGEAL